MLNRRGGESDVVKVLDFGLVKAFDDAESSDYSGGLSGTPLYMSPESMSCLEKTRARRPQTARDLSKLLEACSIAKSWTQDDSEAWWGRHDRELAKSNDVQNSPVNAGIGTAAARSISSATATTGFDQTFAPVDRR